MSDTHRDDCLALARALWPAHEIQVETVRNGKRTGRRVRLVAPTARPRVLAEANSWRALVGELKRARSIRQALTRQAS